MARIEPLTILTWFWKQPGGRAAYSAANVNVWADMVSRNLRMPHRIACVTAHPEGIDGGIDIIAPPGDFEEIRIPTWGDDKPQCLRRIAMFRRDAADIFGPRFACMDMDSIVMGPLDPVFDRPEDFVMFRGTHRSRPYNGSLMMMNAGARPHVYETFTPEGAIKAGFRYVGSDQAWISAALGPGEATWGPEHGIHAHNSSRNGQTDTRILFFFGNPKPWDLLHEDRIRHFYRKAGSGRALVLLDGETVWQDAADALRAGPVDGVIALEGVVPYWPGRICDVAENSVSALQRAHMLGFDDIVICGGEEEAECAYSA
jgi:hypothetical protein